MVNFEKCRAWVTSYCSIIKRVVEFALVRYELVKHLMHLETGSVVRTNIKFLCLVLAFLLRISYLNFEMTLKTFPLMFYFNLEYSYTC